MAGSGRKYPSAPPTPDRLESTLQRHSGHSKAVAQNGGSGHFLSIGDRRSKIQARRIYNDYRPHRALRIMRSPLHLTRTMTRIRLIVATAGCVFATACGGGGSSSDSSSTATTTAISPTIATISPTTTDWNSAAFTLTVTGSGFDQSSVVQLNGYPRPTTYVNSSQLTVSIPATDTLQAGTDQVTVTGSSGQISNAMPFVIPCVFAQDTPASTQTQARLGAYYFDGWAGPLNSYHLALLVNTPYQNREPLSGWRDDNSCAVEQQFAWAHSFGLSFFAFDWYFNAAVNDAQGNENLNSALQITHGLANRHGMQYAILYVDQGNFTITNSTDWNTAVAEWVGYMTDSAYMKVDGKPLLMVIDMINMREAFGSSQAVNAAFSQLRAAAQSHGLPGVYIVGGMDFVGGSPVPVGTPRVDGLFPDLSMAVADGYDAVSMYEYAAALSNLGTISGLQPFSTLADTANWLWTEASSKSPLPFIPVAMDGFDPRPQPPPPPSSTFWVSRTPQDVTSLVTNAISWAESNPALRPEPAPAAPIVILGAWNELLGDSMLVPTVSDGTTFGDALGASLAAPPVKVGTILTLNDSGPASPNRAATGTLTDGHGTALAGVPVSVAYMPASGSVSTYQLSGIAPASAVQSTLGFRINTDQVASWPAYWYAGSTASAISVYQFSYIESGNANNLVANSKFSSGALAWTLGGQSQIVASDQGGGQMVQVAATAAQSATLDSSPFPVTAGAPFQVSISARVPQSSAGSGYFFLAWEDARGNGFYVPIPGPNPNDVKGETIPFTETPLAVGTATTDAGGNFNLSLGALGSQQVVLEGTYAGDAGHWPAYVQASP